MDLPVLSFGWVTSAPRKSTSSPRILSLFSGNIEFTPPSLRFIFIASVHNALDGFIKFGVDRRLFARNNKDYHLRCWISDSSLRASTSVILGSTFIPTPVGSLVNFLLLLNFFQIERIFHFPPLLYGSKIELWALHQEGSTTIICSDLSRLTSASISLSIGLISMCSLFSISIIFPFKNRNRWLVWVLNFGWGK
ncbi:hypothetical protein RCL_jg29403.t1 [Rhizophagus clarus]|uniref:Uncharacterized protein n=1 Tax=Rhizophagus clarus TaxID=94130 RepID=A0A8H3L262_9GLOM|nr:hypothetical protein RCL_jg29403.t1 [Rhizophagus clarus]